MNNNKQYKINSHNEWDKLREIIVGTARNTNATLTLLILLKLNTLLQKDWIII